MAVNSPATRPASLQRVRYIVAIASGKGGVGKSATALNLALSLAAQGLRTGLLDADIYGPSLPGMLGVPSSTRPKIRDQKYFSPIVVQGIATMSMGYLATEKTPMAWRGPMASGALMQMLQQTDWGELDYLLVDMPPGTGDIQLTLAQQIPCTGAVVVTTPQTIATLDAQKGIEMFRKVGIDCLGVVENMSTHLCSHCGHEEAIFGEGGGARIASEYAVPLLGSIPLDTSIRASLDAGASCLLTEPEGPIAARYAQVAKALTEQVDARGTVAPPQLLVSDD